jgi:hypothetical protein
MKKSLITFICALFLISGFAQSEVETEKENIKKLILSAYIDGIHNKGEISQIEKGFHPGFNLLILSQNRLNKLAIYNWIESSKQRKAKNPIPFTEEEKMKCEFMHIDVTGTAAVAKIKLSKSGKDIYIDYLSLYKFEDGWKIVGKIYYRLP